MCMYFTSATTDGPIQFVADGHIKLQALFYFIQDL